MEHHQATGRQQRKVFDDIITNPFITVVSIHHDEFGQISVQCPRVSSELGRHV